MLNKQIELLLLLEEGVISRQLRPLKELREGDRTFRARGTESEHKLIKRTWRREDACIQ